MCARRATSHSPSGACPFFLLLPRLLLSLRSLSLRSPRSFKPPLRPGCRTESYDCFRTRRRSGFFAFCTPAVNVVCTALFVLLPDLPSRLLLRVLRTRCKPPNQSMGSISSVSTCSKRFYALCSVLIGQILCQQEAHARSGKSLSIAAVTNWTAYPISNRERYAGMYSRHSI